MSWNDFYRRRDILRAVLNAAEQDPRGALPFSEVTGTKEEFGTETNLLLALHYKWSQLLAGHLRSELAHAHEGECADAVARAWHIATHAHPTLHTLLAEYINSDAQLRAMHETELRTLAIAAELAQPDEPAEEITRIGRAFLALTSETGRPRARRRKPVEHLRRLLTPTG